MQESIKQPLTNVQLELLKTFAHELTDADLMELKRILAQFFAQKLIQKADEVWEEKQWSDEKVEELLKTKLRKGRK